MYRAGLAHSLTRSSAAVLRSMCLRSLRRLFVSCQTTAIIYSRRHALSYFQFDRFTGSRSSSTLSSVELCGLVSGPVLPSLSPPQTAARPVEGDLEAQTGHRGRIRVFVVVVVVDGRWVVAVDRLSRVQMLRIITSCRITTSTDVTSSRTVIQTLTENSPVQASCNQPTTSVASAGGNAGDWVSHFLPRCMEYRRGLAMRILSVRPSFCLSVCLSYA